MSRSINLYKEYMNLHVIETTMYVLLKNVCL